jgi:hypothetical protein
VIGVIIGGDVMRTGYVREQGFEREGCQGTISVWREGDEKPRGIAIVTFSFTMQLHQIHHFNISFPNASRLFV